MTEANEKNELSKPVSVANDIRRFVGAKAAVVSMAAAFGLVTANPRLERNEVGDLRITAGAENACADWGCHPHVGYVCSPDGDYSHFLQDMNWSFN